MKDSRQPDLCYQEVAAMQVLRDALPSSGGPVKRQQAVAVYQAATEVATEQHRRADFAKARKQIAAFAGVATTTVDRCVEEFQRLGLIHVDPATDDGAPMQWTLLSPGAEPPATAAAAAPAAPDLSPADHETPKTQQAKERDLRGILAAADLGIEGDIINDGVELLRVGKKVDGRLVTPIEMAIATAAIDTFNRHYQHKGREGSDYGLGANLKSIVMRARERPSWDVAKHVRLVESAWRIRWWERNGNDRRPGPNVIYGGKSFEQVVQDAADEAAGEDPAAIKKRRYTRG